MNSGPSIFDEICSGLCTARLSSRKGLGELISKGRYAGASERRRAKNVPPMDDVKPL